MADSESIVSESESFTLIVAMMFVAVMAIDNRSSSLRIRNLPNRIIQFAMCDVHCGFIGRHGQFVKDRAHIAHKGPQSTGTSRRAGFVAISNAFRTEHFRFFSVVPQKFSSEPSCEIAHKSARPDNARPPRHSDRSS